MVFCYDKLKTVFFYRFEERLADVLVNKMEEYRHFDRFKKCGKCELKAWCRGCLRQSL